MELKERTLQSKLRYWADLGKSGMYQTPAELMREAADKLDEVAPLIKLLAEPFCWERDWHPSSSGCGKCRHCRARDAARLVG